MSIAKKAGLIVGVIGAAAVFATTAEGGEGGHGRPVVFVPVQPAPPPGLSVTLSLPLPVSPYAAVPAYPVYETYPVYGRRHGREGGENQQ